MLRLFFGPLPPPPPVIFKHSLAKTNFIPTSIAWNTQPIWQHQQQLSDCTDAVHSCFCRVTGSNTWNIFLQVSVWRQVSRCKSKDAVARYKWSIYLPYEASTRDMIPMYLFAEFDIIFHIFWPASNTFTYSAILYEKNMHGFQTMFGSFIHSGLFIRISLWV